ncbi:hypothetical protein SUDANB176_07822 (plasmid) [Streptomyces sp. enrichment culture]
MWEQGLVPAAGRLLDWRDARHFDRFRDLPCVLCEQPTLVRPHHGEPAHKTCAEAWIAIHPVEARLSRFASDIQPKTKHDNDHI